MAWGIACPVNPKHGNLLPPKSGDSRWWCPHSDHGGNGKFFSDKEAHGEYSIKESDVSVVYEAAARDVIAGKITLDHAVQQAAAAVHLPTSQVREAIAIMIDTIKEKDTDMAEKKKAASAAKQKSQAAAKAGERRRKEHVEGEKFAAVLAEYGLTNKQAAEATGSYTPPGADKPMGASPTYIYIVTHSGSSVDLFANFKAAVAAYAKANGIKRVAAKAVAPEVEAEDEEEVASGAYSETDAEEEIPLEEQVVDAEADEAAAIAEAILSEASTEPAEAVEA